MKAIVRETYGPPDVLVLEEVPLPTLSDGDVLVSAPIGQRSALLIERRSRQPVLFLDSNNDGTFDPSERHVFPRAGDLHVRIPIASNFFSEYPITIRCRWELFKPHGDPGRRMLLESPMVFVGGTVTIAGRPLRVEYPVSPGLWPEMTGGWFRIDANGSDSNHGGRQEKE